MSAADVKTGNLSIARLTIFPVKGLRGVDVDEACITPFGLEGDRRYMLVDQGGTFISQRGHPQLTHIEVEATGDAWRFSMEGHDSLSIPRAGVPDGEEVQVDIWGDPVLARHAGAHASNWFSRVLGDSLRLVWMPESAFRPIEPGYAPQGSCVSFADGYPVLVLSRASVVELNSRLMEPVSEDRFRANIMVDGSAAWAEDGWKSIQTRTATLELVKPCARCVVITTHQQTGERSKEPTATLATYRKREGKVMVGMNALASPVAAWIRTGDALTAK